MPKIHLVNQPEPIQCFTFKIDGLGVLYQVCPIGHKDYHAYMGWVPFSSVARIEHEELPVEQTESEPELIFEVVDENADNLVQGQ